MKVFLTKMSEHKCLAFRIKHSLNAGEGELFERFEGQQDQQDLSVHEIRVEFPLSMQGIKCSNALLGLKYVTTFFTTDCE